MPKPGKGPTAPPATAKSGGTPRSPALERDPVFAFACASLSLRSDHLHSTPHHAGLRDGPATSPLINPTTSTSPCHSLFSAHQHFPSHPALLVAASLPTAIAVFPPAQIRAMFLASVAPVPSDLPATANHSVSHRPIRTHAGHTASQNGFGAPAVGSASALWLYVSHASGRRLARWI